MSTKDSVFYITEPGEDSYPRPLYNHPRNKGIQWLQLKSYTESGLPREVATMDIFVKLSSEVDAIWISGIVGPIVSTRLKSLLEPLIGNSAEFLPIRISGRPSWFLRVLTVLDALDLERSQIRYLSTGSVAAVETPVWRSGEIPDPAIFRIPQDPDQDTWVLAGFTAIPTGVAIVGDPAALKHYAHDPFTPPLIAWTYASRPALPWTNAGPSPQVRR